MLSKYKANFKKIKFLCDHQKSHLTVLFDTWLDYFLPPQKSNTSRLPEIIAPSALRKTLTSIHKIKTGLKNSARLY